MTQTEKIQQLSDLIASTLSRVIDRDYYLLEVPYYNNIGDTLIWQGELDFLRTLPYRCRGMYSRGSFCFPQIRADEMIIFQGGGNFGDLWREHHDFKLEVARRYHDRKILFLPQTVWFANPDNMQATKQALDCCEDVTICARDKRSYQILRQMFKEDRLLLLPDMAFCMDIQKWQRTAVGGKDLLLMRTDKELAEKQILSEQEMAGMEVSDWPTMSLNIPTKILWKLLALPRKMQCLTDIYCGHYYRKYLIRQGEKFIGSHRKVYSTRLHGAILALLLGREVVMFDNSYGKNSSFYNTWLSDCDIISLRQ